MVRYLGPDNARQFFAIFPQWVLMVGERNGALIGLGGVGYMHDGTCFAFCECSGQRIGRYMHRAAKEILLLAKQHAMEIITHRGDQPTASRWLARLGFEYSHMDGDREVWAWRS